MPRSIFQQSMHLALASTVALVAAAPVVLARQAQSQSYDLPAQSLAASIRAVAAISGRSVLAPANLVRDREAPALRGQYTVEEALALLLAGSGLRARLDGANLVIEPDALSPGEGRTTSVSGSEILVTGSRIRGAPVASTVLQLSREDARNAGQATLPDVVRGLPQNFGGGQNPGIGFNVPETNGADIGGGSSINLRGLGGDATLTLLNGHRLSYNAAKQSIDISAIPLGAVERVDVMPDGASALFGSDAVAGVVNVVLRRDLDGLETSALLGGSTDGGNFTQLYGATAGKHWSGGSTLLAYEYGSATAVRADQRGYAATRSPGLTLVPAQRRHSVLVTGRQEVVPGLELSLDGLFNKRWTDLVYPLDFGGDLSVSRGRTFSTAQSWGLAPSLDLHLSDGWTATLSGTWGQDRVDYGGESFAGSVRTVDGAGYYRNRARSIELSTSGSLFRAPGGPAKIAIGGGYRRIDFRRFTGLGGIQNIDRSQTDLYGFGEVSLPLVSREQSIPLVDNMVLSAAARYEDYRGIGDVTTPKLGIIWGLVPDVSVKGSWGKSFRAPTLYQQYQPRTVYLTRITTVGGQGYPSTATALLQLGGNPALRPERSTNWSATLDIHPRALDGFGLELSYFSIQYRDRIVTPIPSFSAALRNPGYAGFVTLNPSASTQAAALAGAGTFTNLTGGAAYNPVNVVALVANNSVNAGRQSVEGIDGVARYSGRAGPGYLSVALNASWLTSEQQIGPALPTTQLAGIIFNPPRLRLRGDLSWTLGALTLTGNVTRIGPVDDNRAAPTVRVHGMTPIDLTLRYQAETGVLRGLDIIASARNLFNAEPDPIATTLFYDTPYDSTNYSPFGRVLSLSVSRKW